MSAMPLERSALERKLRSLIAFALSTADRLQTDASNKCIWADVVTCLESFPNPLNSPIQSSLSEELDRAGTNIWNLSTKMRRDEAVNDVKGLCSLRLFGFFLLDAAQQSVGTSFQRTSRVLKIGLKAIKFCMENNDHDLGIQALERLVPYEAKLAESGNGLCPEEQTKCARLRSDYFQLRTLLAWKQSRLDLAEHTYSKIARDYSQLEPSSAEALADLLYEIGKDLCAKKQYELATKWLERAVNAINQQDLDKLSRDAGELKLSIIQKLVKALRALQSPQSLEQAWNLVNLLETDYGERLVVSLLRLELLGEEEDFDAESYRNVLLRIVRSVVLTEGNFKTIFYHIHKLKNKSVKLACIVLDELISQRLFECDRPDWLEKAVITKLWLCVNHSLDDELLEDVSGQLNHILANSTETFSPAATHAAQTLMWKRIEACFLQNQFDTTRSWCQLSLHGLFEKSGELNKIKIWRKLILCAIGLQDLASAREIFYKMPEEGKSAPLTRYIMWKVALRSGDPEFASDCLDIVSQHSKVDHSLLYACALEAQHCGDHRQAISVLMRVLQKNCYNVVEGVNLAALVRCTVRLLVQECFVDGKIDQQVAEEICKLFEGAASKAKESYTHSLNQASVFNAQELEWFAKNSYNLALKYCTDMPPNLVARMLLSSTQCIELLLEHGSESEGLPLRKVFCNFIITAIYTAMARDEDQRNRSFQLYTSARKTAGGFRALLTDIFTSAFLNDKQKEDLIIKHHRTTLYELEAALHLKDWDSIDSLFQEMWRFEAPKRLDALADITLVVHSTMVQEDLDPKYQAKVLAVLQKIINLSWRANEGNTGGLARWIRCLFQISLAFDERISLQCLDQATRIATSLRKKNAMYPNEELEWLAATSFNRAVDFYCASDNSNCKVWAEKALELTATAGAGVGLHKLLMEKYGQLAWE